MAVRLGKFLEESHTNLTQVTSDQHHAQSHTLASHSAKAHSDLTGVGIDDHHAQGHTLASHSARAHSDLTGITVDQHHTENHASRHASGGADALSLMGRLQASDTTERSTQSTSLVDIATISSLSIPASKAIRIMASLKYIHVATSAGAKIGLKLNTTQVRDPEALTFFSVAASSSGQLMWDIPPRESSYVRGGIGICAVNNPNPVSTYATDADAPTTTITSIVLHGRVLNGSNTIAIKNIRVYAYDP
ncbi:MAG: hypothetical protein HY681_10960 [Chloroflexi bacterium]|nr:hypothetical protein [Chloroflexota bacterium]